MELDGCANLDNTVLGRHYGNPDSTGSSCRPARSRGEETCIYYRYYVKNWLRVTCVKFKQTGRKRSTIIVLIIDRYLFRIRACFNHPLVPPVDSQRQRFPSLRLDSGHRMRTWREVPPTRHLPRHYRNT
jgi:hypothetical protein